MVVALVGLVAPVRDRPALRPVELMRAEADAITHSTLHRRVPVRSRASRRDRAALLEPDAQRHARPARRIARAPASIRGRRVARAADPAGDAAGRARGRPAGQGARRRCAAAWPARSPRRPGSRRCSPTCCCWRRSRSRRPRRADPVDLGAIARAEAERPRADAGHGVGDWVTAWCGAGGRSWPGSSPTCSTTLPATPRSSVLVTVDGGRMVVEDDGPAIPEADREADLRAVHPARRRSGPGTPAAPALGARRSSLPS